MPGLASVVFHADRGVKQIQLLCLLVLARAHNRVGKRLKAGVGHLLQVVDARPLRIRVVLLENGMVPYIVEAGMREVDDTRRRALFGRD